MMNSTTGTPNLKLLRLIGQCIGQCGPETRTDDIARWAEAAGYESVHGGIDELERADLIGVQGLVAKYVPLDGKSRYPVDKRPKVWLTEAGRQALKDDEDVANQA